MIDRIVEEASRSRGCICGKIMAQQNKSYSEMYAGSTKCVSLMLIVEVICKYTMQGKSYTVVSCVDLSVLIGR